MFKLIEICDGLDYTELYQVYLLRWRKIDPATLFEILVFAYRNGIYPKICFTMLQTTALFVQTASA